MKKKFIIIFILLCSGAAGFILSYYHYAQTSPNTEIQTLETVHYPALFVRQLTNDPHAGEKIFQEFCSACHSRQPVINVNAPRIGDTNAWRLRRRKGIDNLLKITINGKRAMPARGGCFECSDAQLRETIQYMLQ